MACDTIKIETLDADEVVSIVTQGPQGPSGSEAATLTTVGDTLYRGVTAPERLAIGTPGQVLKVNSTATAPEWGNESGAVTSVNGQTGTVVIEAGDITDFTTAAAAAAPVSSVAGRTGAITLAVADVSGAVADTDARLSDSRTPTSHAASHLPEGDDELFDQSLNTDDDVAFEKVTVGGEAEITFSAINWSGNPVLNLEEKLFYDGGGDGQENILWGRGGDNDVQFFKPISFTSETTAETTRDNLGLGDSAIADIGTTAGTVAAGDDSRFSDIPDPSAATPQPLGAASAGTSDDYSRGDHVHAAPALNDLSNVSAATPSDNDVLVFDTATSTWVAEAPSGGGGASLMQSIAVGLVLN